jgi:non-specific protein-tyrosine kinase
MESTVEKKSTHEKEVERTAHEENEKGKNPKLSPVENGGSKIESEIIEHEETMPEKDQVVKECRRILQKRRNMDISKKVAKKYRITYGLSEDKLDDYYKVLRTHIMHKMNHKNQKRFLITSAVAGEGKTITALNIAISFSKVIDLNVILVEADLRRPVMQKYLWYERPLRGLADYLLDDVPINELLLNPGIPELYILFAGRSIPDSTELLGSTKMKKLIDDLTCLYKNSYIIFDMTSIHEFPDALVLTEFVDKVLFVVAAESTPLEKVITAQKKIKDLDILGVVLNKAFL